MSNTSKGAAVKGSKFMIQIAASNLAKVIIDKRLQDELIWLSPREEDNYEEYQLSETKVLDFLGIDSSKKKLFDFWPSRQPQWDGIAIGKDSGTLYLFEAKSHLKETTSNCSASSATSRDIIKKTIKDIAKNVYHIEDMDIIDNYWMQENYQIANRLVFLQKMKEVQSNASFYEGVKLVFLNFVNDYTWEESEVVKDPEEWTKHYNTIFKKMGLKREEVEAQGLIELNYYAPHA